MFSNYIRESQALIKTRRTDFAYWRQKGVSPEQIINANSPFELLPDKNNQKKYGVLLIHGLLDCPFSLREVGTALQTQGILTRAILLPGHGTTPSDLLTVTFEQWIQAVEYGIDTLQKEVEQVFLIGYSTGAVLSVYESLQRKIQGIVLLSPAIQIKVPSNLIATWRYIRAWFSLHKKWIVKEQEIDYVKYLSLPFNAVTQVNALIAATKQLNPQKHLKTPLLMIISREDETVSSHQAIDFFTTIKNPRNRLLLYSAQLKPHYIDTRIETRRDTYPTLGIRHFSHVSIPFSPQNQYYGPSGDYVRRSQIDHPCSQFGAYNRVEAAFYYWLFKLHLIKCPRQELTYNPDFTFMTQRILEFLETIAE